MAFCVRGELFLFRQTSSWYNRGGGVQRVSGAGRAVGTRLGGAAVWESESMQSDSGRGVFCSSFIQVLIICSL